MDWNQQNGVLSCFIQNKSNVLFFACPGLPMARNQVESRWGVMRGYRATASLLWLFWSLEWLHDISGSRDINYRIKSIPANLRITKDPQMLKISILTRFITMNCNLCLLQRPCCTCPYRSMALHGLNVNSSRIAIWAGFGRHTLCMLRHGGDQKKIQNSLGEAPVKSAAFQLKGS